MSDHTNEQEEIESFDEDLESGFADDVEVELTETPSEAEEVVEPEAAETQEPEQIQPWYARVSEDQFNELMNKANSVETLQAEHRRAMDQVFGKIGSMKQVLEQRQTEGSSVEFSKDDFEDMAQEYPEFAETIAKAMTAASKKLRVGGSAAEPVDVKAIEDQVRVALNEEVLAEEHEGWQEFVQTNEFRTWLNTKPEDYQQKLVGSKSARFIGKGLAECKAWVAEKQEAQRVTQEKAQKQSARFAAAVNPKSASSNATSSSKSEDDLLEEGFN